VLLDIENIGNAVGILLLSCVQAEIYVISSLLPVQATIFDCSLTPTKGSVLLDIENIGIAVGIYTFYSYAYTKLIIYLCHH